MGGNGSATPNQTLSGKDIMRLEVRNSNKRCRLRVEGQWPLLSFQNMIWVEKGITLSAAGVTEFNQEPLYAEWTWKNSAINLSNGEAVTIAFTNN